MIFVDTSAWFSLYAPNDKNHAEAWGWWDADFDAAWEVFQKFEDKAWSFTDCTSRVVMERPRPRPGVCVR